MGVLDRSMVKTIVRLLNDAFDIARKECGDHSMACIRITQAKDYILEASIGDLVVHPLTVAEIEDAGAKVEGL